MKASGTVVWLQAEPVELASWLDSDGRERPLLAGADGPVGTLTRRLEERTLLYGAVADHAVSASGRAPEDTAGEIGLLWRH